jgi:transposase
MPFPRKRKVLQFSEQEVRTLESIRRSRTDEKRRTQRAGFLLDSAAGQSDEAIARHHHVSRSTVVLCIQKFLQFGLDAALGELPRPGKPRQLPDDAIAWVQNCACQKPKELGYSYELWTYKLLVAHIRGHCVAAGLACRDRLFQALSLFEVAIRLAGRYGAVPHQLLDRIGELIDMPQQVERTTEALGFLGLAGAWHLS